MYIVEEIIDINWELHSDPGKFLTKDLFDVITISPAGVSTYYVDPIINWLMPYTQHEEGCNDVDIVGNATYAFTADKPGRWRILLVSGTADDYELLDTVHIYALCDLTTTPSDLNALATRQTQSRPYCGEEPVNMRVMNGTFWRGISAIGRGIVPGTIMFWGSKVSGNRDVGILDTATGDVTEYLGILSGGAIPANNTWGQFDVDRSTGRVVVQQKQSQGNYYPVYYCDNMLTGGVWQAASTPNTNFRGADYVHYSTHLGVWFVQTGIELFVSNDGANYVYQTRKNYYNQAIINNNYSFGILDPEENPLDSNVSIMPVTQEYSIRLEVYSGYKSAPFEPGCFTGFCNPTEYDTVTGAYATPDRTVFDHTQFSQFTGGVCATYGDNAAVYMMSQFGEIAKNDGNMREFTWTVLAERDYGQVTSHPTNELMEPTQGTITPRSFMHIDGAFHCKSSIGNRMWSYDGFDPEGLGWYPAPIDSIWGYGGLLIYPHIWCNRHDEKFAFSGYYAPSDYFKYWVFYDAGYIA